MVHDGRVEAKGGLPIDAVVGFGVGRFDHAVDGEPGAFGEIEGGGRPGFAADAAPQALRWKRRVGPDVLELVGGICHVGFS